MISHGVYIECKRTMWSSSRNLSLIRMFHESVTVVRQSLRKLLDLYVLKDILQSDWFISLTKSRNSTWTVGIWHINPVIQQQGLVLDPKLFRIRDAGLLFISGNVRRYIFSIFWDMLIQIPKIYWFITLTTFTNSIGTFSYWYITKWNRSKDSFWIRIFSGSGTVVCYSF